MYTKIRSQGNAMIMDCFWLRKQNTGIKSHEWKNSYVSFMDCTKSTYQYGIEKFLDEIVVKRVAQIEISGNHFDTIINGTNGPIYCALILIHNSKNYYGGFVFTYEKQTAQFNYENGRYGIRFF